MMRARKTLPPATRTNVVAPVSTFFGRQAELASIERLFAGGARLVSVVGPPGMGKTRLLLRYAETSGAPFLGAGGVWLCDLTEATTVADACNAVLETLGERPPRGLADHERVAWVARILAELGSTLLLCDNFEQLDDATTTAVETWCATDPELRVLVTSRRRLATPIESVFELGPLDLPADARDAGSAVGLFVDRARACGGTVDDETSIRAIVNELDGLPLAIELAAARTRVMTPSELRARLAQNHDVLSQGAPRLRSLRTALERTWDVLAARERSVLAQCSYFAKDFSLAAAEAVIVYENAPDHVMDALASLRDRSLLSARDDAGQMRFRMIASLRDFARAKLEDAARTDVARRHRRYFADHGRAIAETLWRSGHIAQRQALTRERDNLHLAYLSRVSDVSPDEQTRRDTVSLALAREPLLSLSGNHDELLAMLDEAEPLAAALGDARALGCLQIARGTTLGLLGNVAESTRVLTAAKDLGARAGLSDVAAEALVMLAVRRRARGEMEEALALTREGEAQLTPGAWPRIEGSCTVVGGMVLVELGRHDEAQAANLRARAIFAAAEDRWSEALAIANLAQLDQAQGELDRAARGFDEAVAVFERLGDRTYGGRYLGYRAALEHERGDLPAARAMYRRALDVIQGLGLTHHEAHWRACLGALEARDGDRRLAKGELLRARDLMKGVDVPVFASVLEVHHAHLDLLRGDERAARARIEPPPAFYDASEDVRFAVRLVARALATSRAPAPRGQGPTLTISPGVMSFRVDAGESVDLTKRGAQRRILAWLVDQHRDAPGTASDWQVLLEKGWPNERVLAEAGATRVRVAVATLRKLGLAGVLVTRDDGYLLGERVRVQIADAINEG